MWVKQAYCNELFYKKHMQAIFDSEKFVEGKRGLENSGIVRKTSLCCCMILIQAGGSGCAAVRSSASGIASPVTTCRTTWISFETYTDRHSELLVCHVILIARSPPGCLAV